MAIERENFNVIKLSVGTLIFLGILYATNPPLKDNLFTYMILLGIAILVYSSRFYQKFLIGIETKTLFKSFFYAILLTLSFFLMTKLIPGLSIGVPLLPQAISDTLRFSIIVFFAPIVEEIFFRGSLMAYIKNLQPSKSRVQIVIIIQAILFALAHLGAYITNFYDYSTITVGLSVFWANVSVFISAGLFGYISGFIVSKPKINNLVFSILFHGGVNFLIFGQYILISP